MDLQPSLITDETNIANLPSWQQLEFCRRNGYRSRLGKPPKLFDAFPFNSEFELLEMRLKELYPVVDEFILMEAPTTYSGNPKPMHFKLNKSGRFSQYLDKIVHIEINFTLDHEIDCNGSKDVDCKHWIRENKNRDDMVLAFQQLEADESDVVLSADVDEIVPRATAWSLKLCDVPTPMTIYSELFYYNWKWRFSYSDGSPFSWPHPQVATVRQIRKLRASIIRGMGPFLHPYVYTAGWHLSYFMNATGILSKLSAFAHQKEQTPDMRRLEWLQECIDEGKDLVNDTLRFHGSTLTAQPPHAKRRPISVRGSRSSDACERQDSGDSIPGSDEAVAFHQTIPLKIPQID